MQLEKNPTTRKIVRAFLTLEDRVAGLPFPKMKRVKQIDSDHCGPAVLASLYSNFGVRVSQRGITGSLRAQNKIKEFGLNINDLARGAKIIGKGNFNFWKKSNGKVSDLDLIVNKYNFPVAVEWQGVFYEDEDDDNGHYCIITRVDKKNGTIRLSDPYEDYAGVDRKFKISEFKKRWWDENIIHGRNLVDNKVMFLITPSGETWPKKLGMVKK